MLAPAAQQQGFVKLASSQLGYFEGLIWMRVWWIPDSAFSLSFEEDAGLAQFASPLSLQVLPFKRIVLSFVMQTGKQRQRRECEGYNLPQDLHMGKAEGC